MKPFVKLKTKKKKNGNLKVITKTNLDNEDLAYILLKTAYESVNSNEETLLELQMRIANDSLVENERNF